MISRLRKVICLCYSVFDGASYGTKQDGARPSLAEFIISTNMTLRNERLSDRVLFIQFRRWDHLVSNEEKNAMTRRIKTIVSDKKESPIDYVAGLSSYIFTDQYKQRLNEHSETVQDLLECKTRTSRNYAFGLVFVDLLFDEFEEELKAVKLTREGFYHYLKTDFLPSIKPFHEEADDHIKVCCWLG